MPYIRTVVLTSLAMMAFAANSLLCRAALAHTEVDAATFTSIRLISGALMLWLIVQIRHNSRARLAATTGAGNWLSAIALFVYAAGFSFSYISLPTGTGALLLFGAVQATMIGYSLWLGERLRNIQILGLVLALIGLTVLMLPGLSAPPLYGAILMLGAGVAWGAYSLRGKTGGDATMVTAGNFLRTIPIALVLSFLMIDSFSIDRAGFLYAVGSGALASGVGYAIWYTVLPALKSSSAATVQLSVPVIAAIAGIVLLSEPLTLRLILSSIAILGGIALFILQKESVQKKNSLKADRVG